MMTMKTNNVVTPRRIAGAIALVLLLGLGCVLVFAQQQPDFGGGNRRNNRNFLPTDPNGTDPGGNQRRGGNRGTRQPDGTGFQRPSRNGLTQSRNSFAQADTTTADAAAADTATATVTTTEDATAVPADAPETNSAPAVVSTAPERAAINVVTGRGTNGPMKLDYAAFRIISDRNIFDPNRRARQPGRTVPRPVRVDTISLTGAMDSDKGPVAIFNGSSPLYRKGRRIGETIANFTVKEVQVTPGRVKIEANGKELELPMGGELRRREGEDWVVRGGSDTSGFAGRIRWRRRRVMREILRIAVRARLRKNCV